MILHLAVLADNEYSIACVVRLADDIFAHSHPTANRRISRSLSLPKWKAPARKKWLDHDGGKRSTEQRQTTWQMLVISMDLQL